jgi:thiamine-monophosphate kinase
LNLSEFSIISIIKSIFQPILAPGANELLDDGASLSEVPLGHRRVMSMDAFQEHNDFRIGLGPLKSAGHRAITQNLSDMAAMGAKPVGFLWSLELPEIWLQNDADYLKQFCLGVADTAKASGLRFYGGDLSLSRLYFSCAISIFGDVAGIPLSRQRAKPGDKIYVSRTLGASAAGLENLFANTASPATETHLWPKAEVELGQKLVSIATACMDLSDGLAKDLDTLCFASGVGARVHTIPTHPWASEHQALYGGEDYALLYTAPQCDWGIEIGEITSDPKQRPFKAEGFDHFKR